MEIEQVGREYDKESWLEDEFPEQTEGREGGGKEPPERPVRFLDVAADFIAVGLIQRIPDLEVPLRLQQEWLNMLDPCVRVRALNAFVVEALDDVMTPDGIYRRALEATIKRYERVLAHRRDEPRKEDMRSEGNELLQEKHRGCQGPVGRPGCQTPRQARHVRHAQATAARPVGRRNGSRRPRSRRPSQYPECQRSLYMRAQGRELHRTQR